MSDPIPSLADLVTDYIEDEPFKMAGVNVTTRNGVSYLTIDGDHGIAQIVDNEVRFAPIHLNAANPKFFAKLERVVGCFDSIIEIL